MPYSPPTRATLRASISRDLRDSANNVFSTSEVNDLINWGIVEVNRVYPLAGIEDVDIIDDGNGSPVRVYGIDSVEISRVEIWRDGVFKEAVPQMGEMSNSGWDLFGSTFILPTWLALNDATDVVKVYGYQDRDPLDDDSDVLNSDPDAEMGIRIYSVMRGYQRLQNDRALFQQWLATPGNRDISPTQLDGMANTYLADWNRQRKQMRRIRR